MKKWRLILKKSLKILCRFLLVFVLFAICVTLYYMMPQYLGNNVNIDKSSDSADVYDYTQDNYTLVRLNNKGRLFPFCFGERLCLYDIKSDKYITLVNNISPGWTIGDQMAMCNENVVYEAGIGDSYGGLYSINIRTGKRHKILSQSSAYSLCKDKLYYVKDYFQEGHKSVVYGKFITGGNRKKIFDGHVTCMTIQRERIYRFDEVKKSIIITEAGAVNERIIRYPYEGQVVSICKTENSDFAIIDTVGAVRYYNTDSASWRFVAKIDEPVEFVKNIYFSHNAFYYCADNCKLYKLDIGTGNYICLIDLGKNRKIKKYFETIEPGTSVNYSYNKEYIIVDAYYDNNENSHEKLLIFDYSGKLVRERTLQ